VEVGEKDGSAGTGDSGHKEESRHAYPKKEGVKLFGAGIPRPRFLKLHE
jgi:hypothetical protein